LEFIVTTLQGAFLALPSRFSLLFAGLRIDDLLADDGGVGTCVAFGVLLWTIGADFVVFFSRKLLIPPVGALSFLVGVGIGLMLVFAFRNAAFCVGRAGL
jgi:hypothetical protein